MTELHRLTLRQINENPTMMSDEVFVPWEEVGALLAELNTLKKALADPEAVHVAMLRGTIATITMRQAAHLAGPKTMEAFNRWDDLRGDLKSIEDILCDYDEPTVIEQAQAAVAEVRWLREQFTESQAEAYNATSEAKLLRALVRRCREVLETNDPLNARNIFGPTEDAKALAKRGIVL